MDDHLKELVARRLRSAGRRRRGGFKSWTEKDVLNGNVVDAAVVILDTSGCFWVRSGGCTMCGYVTDTSPPDMPPSEQFSAAMEKTGWKEYVKIFNSGSFLDRREVPEDDVENILALCAENGVKKLVVESRPEFVNEDLLSPLKRYAGKIDLSVAIGLESASDFVRDRCIHKGFTYKAYEKAAGVLKDSGLSLKTYLLFKPPFLSDRDAYHDALYSIEKAIEYSNEISVNPMNIQSGTLVEEMYRKGLYRTPWLLDLLALIVDGQRLINSAGRHPSVRLMTSPTGAGTPRGAHDCTGAGKNVEKMLYRLSTEPYTGGDMKALHEEAEALISGSSCAYQHKAFRTATYWETYSTEDIFTVR